MKQHTFPRCIVTRNNPCQLCKLLGQKSLRAHRRRQPQRRRQSSSFPASILHHLHPPSITHPTLVPARALCWQPSTFVRPSQAHRLHPNCILHANLYNHLNHSFARPGCTLVSGVVWSALSHFQPSHTISPTPHHQRMWTNIMSRLTIFRSALLLAAALPAVFAQTAVSCGDGNLCPSSAPCCSRQYCLVCISI